MCDIAGFAGDPAQVTARATAETAAQAATKTAAQASCLGIG